MTPGKSVTETRLLTHRDALAARARNASLRALIREAAQTIMEMGCTCADDPVDPKTNHQRDCVGVVYANDILKRAEREKA